MRATGPRRVVITGVGVVSPLGCEPAAFWQALVEGRSGVRPLRAFPGRLLPAPYGAEAAAFTGAIEDFGPLDKPRQRSLRKAVKLMCREIQMGVAAAQRALAHAGWRPGQNDPDRCGVVYGSDHIMTAPEEFAEAVRRCLDEQGRFQFDRWAEAGMSQVTPLWLLKYLPNMAACHIAIQNDFRGVNNSITLREASANLAVGEAYQIIRRGAADLMVAGATGTRIHPVRTIHVALQEQLAAANGQADPATLSRPFDRDRTGMVLGEGAGALVLESLEAAEARGAPVLAEVVGHGSAVAADRRGAARLGRALEAALRRCLEAAGAAPRDVGHIHAHGLATRTSDVEEARAIRAVFGSRAASAPLVAAKSHFGNLGAGGGAVELAASVLALQHGRLFPVLNYETPDPECPVAPVRDAQTPAGSSFVSLSAAPQGQASVVAVRAPA